MRSADGADQRLGEALFEQAHAPMVVVEATGEVRVTNAAFRVLAGRDRVALTGRAFVETFALASRDRVSALIARVAVERSPQERLRLTFANGRSHHIECFGRALEDGTGGSLWTFLDVTERERRERAIERYELFSRHTADIVLFVGRDGRILEANQAAVAAYGYTREELLARNIEDLRAPATRSVVFEQVDEAFEGGLLMETVHCRKDGSEFPVEVGSRSAMIGNERMLLSIIRDISGRSLAQTKLIQADRMAALGTMAAGIAHEVNNPLAYTIVNLQVARKRLQKLASSIRSRSTTPPPDDLAHEMEGLTEMLDLAHEGTARVRAIIDDLRAFSRHDDIAAHPIELSSVIDAAAEIASGEIRHRAKLVRDYGQAPLVRASGQRLTQVFLNLLVNAAQAIPEGNVEGNEIRVSVGTSATGDAEVEVRDTGRGISDELTTRIFDAFFTTKPLEEGTGLGLFISRTIVTGYEGNIHVENAPDRGTVFRVSLPAATP